MGNVDNIVNGCYKGISSSASHRFSIQWTGDTTCDQAALAQEVDNLVRAGDSCIAYVNSDCGGHIGNPDKENFIRWMQFGTLSPVFRPHCTKDVVCWRDPWAYDQETLEIVRNYNNLRYRLLPIIYKNAYNNYFSGEPIFKSLCYEYPNDKLAAKENGAYMLGNDLLIAPIVGGKVRLVEEGNYAKPVVATYYNGRELQGEPIVSKQYSLLNMDLNNTAPESGVPMYDFSARFSTAIKFDQDVKLFVCSDDGATVWIDGEKVLDDKTLHGQMLSSLGVIQGGKEHEIEVEYFQAGGAAHCSLHYQVVTENKSKSVYLPKGKWMDLFDGKVYSGGKTLTKQYPIDKSPLFVRLGALLPIAYNAKNTKQQKWDKLVYHFFPCVDSVDQGYLYEDDGETTAYQTGKFATSEYSANYDKYLNAFAVNFAAINGSFDGERFVAKRNVTVKYHAIKGVDNVSKVTINGKPVDFVVTKKNSSAMPFETDASADNNTIDVTFELDTNQDGTVVFYLQ